VSSLSEHNKSALTDHAAQEYHMINWCGDRQGAIALFPVDQKGKEGQQAMNRDEGSYQLKSRL